MAYALVLVPLLLALVAFAVPDDRTRPWVVTVGGTLHLALTIFALRMPVVDGLEGWLLLGPLGKLVLGLTSTLFFFCSVYLPGYLAQRPERQNRLFCTCLLLFIAMLTVITEAQHLGLMWVAIEATTLTTAPLLYFNRNARSLEATWKYLLIGSVGIALALLGSLFLAYSALKSGLQPSLLINDLVRDAPKLSKPWLHAAFVILFVGYGTKMGLAPMHTWKPDAYGEAPGVVGALLAGGLTNCAFMAILRFFRVCAAAGDATFARDLMVVMGLLSMGVAGVFMARQRDYKRMLAYSSVEHMGILVLGVGLGGAASFGAMLHMVNNGLTKGVLFLTAANIHRAYGSKDTSVVSGAIRRLPLSGGLFFAGFFAVTGAPPFGPFISELAILDSAIHDGRFVVGALYLVALLVVFLGMGATVVSMVQGKASSAASSTTFRDGFLTVAPAIACLSLVLMLGVWLPAPLDTMIRNAAAFVEGAP